MSVRCTQPMGSMSSVVFIAEMLVERTHEATCEFGDTDKVRGGIVGTGSTPDI